jgi:hypothetical protein
MINTLVRRTNPLGKGTNIIYIGNQYCTSMLNVQRYFIYLVFVKFQKKKNSVIKPFLRINFDIVV